MRKVMLGAAAAALLAGTTAAQAAPVPRTASPVVAGNNLHGGELWLALLAVALLAVILVAINDKNNENLPHSP